MENDNTENEDFALVTLESRLEGAKQQLNESEHYRLRNLHELAEIDEGIARSKARIASLENALRTLRSVETGFVIHHLDDFAGPGLRVDLDE